MTFLYIWSGLAGLLCVLFVLKLVLQIGLAGSGRYADWLLGLLIVLFFPVMVLAACLKKVR
mgnify:CR=1 FL=1